MSRGAFKIVGLIDDNSKVLRVTIGTQNGANVVGMHYIKGNRNLTVVFDESAIRTYLSKSSSGFGKEVGTGQKTPAKLTVAFVIKTVIERVKAYSE